MNGNINTILQAHNRTREKFEQFIEKPDEFELEILLQFLFYRSFKMFHKGMKLCDPDLATDFWFKLNDEIIDKHGVSSFHNFAELRKKRFKEYDPLYDMIYQTDLFFHGQPSNDETENKIIEVWGLTVFPNIKNNNQIDMDKIIQFPSRCFGMHTIHLAGILGDYDFEKDELKDI